MSSAVKDYLSSTSVDKISEGFLAYIASLAEVKKTFPEIASSVVKELEAQRSHLKLIASENYSSLATQLSMGNLLTDKYAEGFAGHRFYAGCENVDDIEAAGVARGQVLKAFHPKLYIILLCLCLH